MKRRLPEPSRPILPPPPPPPVSFSYLASGLDTPAYFLIASPDSLRHDQMLYNQFLVNSVLKYKSPSMHKSCQAINMTHLSYLFDPRPNSEAAVSSIRPTSTSTKLTESTSTTIKSTTASRSSEIVTSPANTYLTQLLNSLGSSSVHLVLESLLVPLVFIVLFLMIVVFVLLFKKCIASGRGKKASSSSSSSSFIAGYGGGTGVNSSSMMTSIKTSASMMPHFMINNHNSTLVSSLHSSSCSPTDDDIKKKNDLFLKSSVSTNFPPASLLLHAAMPHRHHQSLYGVDNDTEPSYNVIDGAFLPTGTQSSRSGGIQFVPASLEEINKYYYCRMMESQKRLMDQEAGNVYSSNLSTFGRVLNKSESKNYVNVNDKSTELVLDTNRLYLMPKAYQESSSSSSSTSSSFASENKPQPEYSDIEINSYVKYLNSYNSIDLVNEESGVVESPEAAAEPYLLMPLSDRSAPNNNNSTLFPRTNPKYINERNRPSCVKLSNDSSDMFSDPSTTTTNSSLSHHDTRRESHDIDAFSKL